MEKYLYGNSRSFKKALAITDQYAKSNWPILILGESGVGKELIAERLHQESSRRDQPFIPINCGALPPTLFESELFGYEKGAFSGAFQHTKGLVRMAEGGTLFLDEIGDLELPLQVKLLRLLESQEIRSVGSSKIEKVDVRVIAATNRELYQCVGDGSFRLDLLERISVLTLKIPPLRDREDDIELLSRKILNSLNCSYDEASLALLNQYSWPGNIRQLKNVLIRASVLCPAEGIQKPLMHELLTHEKELEMKIFKNPKQIFLQGSLEEIEKQIIKERLSHFQGNKKKTAVALGIAKSTLHEKIKKWKGQGDTYFLSDNDEDDCTSHAKPAIENTLRC